MVNLPSSMRGGVAILLALLTVSGCGTLYPPGPATQNFDQYSCLELPGSTSTGPPDTANKPSGSAKTDIDNFCTNATDKSVKGGVKCAETARNVYGGFLMCRERRQLVAAGSIATLAAAASGVAAAGVSWVAAASLGAASGAGLGFEYATYNKPKTKAYADATVQLQCVIGYSSPLESKDLELATLSNGTAANPSETVLPDSQVQEKLNKLQECEDNHYLTPDIVAKINLVSAEYNLARQREYYTRSALALLGPDIFLAVDDIDVRAFAESQSGVPDPDQIEKGVQAVSVPMPSNKAATAAAPKPAKKGLSLQEVVPVIPAQCRPDGADGFNAVLNQIAETTESLNQSLGTIRLPDPQFADCLAIKAYDDSTSKASSGSKTSAGGKSKKPQSASKTTGDDSDNSDNDNSSNNQTAKSNSNNDDTPVVAPTKVAFQVMPSDEVTVDNDSLSAVVKVTGGTAPYYAVAVDPGVGVVKATQTDPFVSYEVSLAKTATSKQRLLVGDQGGSVEIVYVSSASPPKPAKAPTAKKKKVSP